MAVPLNIAAGAGGFSPGTRFYRMAHRSATECAAILDSCTVAMLAAMLLCHTEQGSGST